MPIPVQDIYDRVIDLLLDADRSQPRWPDAELVRWINDSRMAVITRRPQASAAIETMQLVAGSKQSIPADGTILLDVIRNMGATGTTPGRSIRRTDRQGIDDMAPYWHKSAATNEVSQFTFDDRMPKDFYVYPPSRGESHVELSYTKIPAAITAIGGNLEMSLEYMDAVVNYVAYRAKSKDSEYANAAEAAAYYGAFTDALGVNANSQVATSPNQPGNSV